MWKLYLRMQPSFKQERAAVSLHCLWRFGKSGCLMTEGFSQRNKWARRGSLKPLRMRLLIGAAGLRLMSAAGEVAVTGQPADIAPSAYLYRADRQPEENPPEAWI